MTDYPRPTGTGYPVTDTATRTISAGTVTLILTGKDGTAPESGEVTVNGGTVFYGTGDQAYRFVTDLIFAARALTQYIEAEAQGRG